MDFKEYKDLNMRLLKQPAISAGKEMGRVIALAIIPLLIMQLEAGRIEWRALAVVGAIAALRAIDKYLHKAGNEKGLTQF